MLLNHLLVLTMFSQFFSCRSAAPSGASSPTRERILSTIEASSDILPQTCGYSPPYMTVCNYLGKHSSGRGEDIIDCSNIGNTDGYEDFMAVVQFLLFIPQLIYIFMSQVIKNLIQIMIKMSRNMIRCHRLQSLLFS